MLQKKDKMWSCACQFPWNLLLCNQLSVNQSSSLNHKLHHLISEFINCIAKLTFLHSFFFMSDDEASSNGVISSNGYHKYL